MPEELSVIKQEATTVMAQARALVVDDPESYTLAGQVSSACTRSIKRFEGIFIPIKDREYAAYKATSAELANLTQPIVEVREEVDKKAYLWHVLDLARIRGEDEAERRRVKAENDRKIKEREDAVLDAAEALEAFGDGQEALEILEHAIPVVAEQPQSHMVMSGRKPMKVAGISHRENWQFEVIGELSVEWTKRIPDMEKIKEEVKKSKGQTAIPGVKVWDAGTTIHK